MEEASKLSIDLNNSPLGVWCLDYKAAAERLSGIAIKTPLHLSHSLSKNISKCLFKT
jgi:threonine dehydratase